MKGNIPLGRYAGIPIRAHWTILIPLAFATFQLAAGLFPSTITASTRAYWLTAGIFVLLFATTLLAHELAHAALARRFGVRVESITIWIFGGVTRSSNEPPTPGKAALIAGIGPAVSIGVSAVFYGLAVALGGGLAALGLAWLALINLFLAALNLLPGAPLDGGRLLEAWLWHRSGDHSHAAVRAAKFGMGIVTGLTAAGVVLTWFTNDLGDALWLLMLGMFLLVAVVAELARASAPLLEVPVGQVMAANPVIAPGGWTVEDFVRYLAANRIEYRLFPVQDIQGTPTGVVERRDLLGVKKGRRTAVHVRDLAHPLDARFVARPEEPLAAVLHRTTLRPAKDTVLVVDDHRPVGTLTATDVRRTVS